jgi:hypothetical protein
MGPITMNTTTPEEWDSDTHFDIRAHPFILLSLLASYGGCDETIARDLLSVVAMPVFGAGEGACL